MNQADQSSARLGDSLIDAVTAQKTGGAGLEDKKPMSVGDWMLTIFILAIPIVNIIMYFYWALSSSGNVSRKNFCIASLLWGAIILVIVMIFLGIAATIGFIAGTAGH